MARDMEKRKAYLTAYREKTREHKRLLDRERMAAWRKTEEYKRWLIETRDRRRDYKSKYRREAGATPLHEIHLEAQRKAEIRAAERAAKKSEIDSFVGPSFPSSSVNPTAYYRIRYASDEQFREKEKARVAARKQTVPLYYAKQMLGIKGEVPASLIEAKRLQLIIKKTLRSMANEECE
jgi:hypothetical protein